MAMIMYANSQAGGGSIFHTGWWQILTTVVLMPCADGYPTTLFPEWRASAQEDYSLNLVETARLNSVEHTAYKAGSLCPIRCQGMMQKSTAHRRVAGEVALLCVYMIVESQCKARYEGRVFVSPKTALGRHGVGEKREGALYLAV